MSAPLVDIPRPPAPARSTVHLDSEALYVALDKVRRQRKMSWRRAAHAAGVAPSAITRLGRGSGLSAEGLLRLVEWADLYTVLPAFVTGRQVTP